jgi:hypothetical protein
MFGSESKRALAENIGPALQAVKDAGRALVAIAVVAVTALVVSIIALVKASRPA